MHADEEPSATARAPRVAESSHVTALFGIDVGTTAVKGLAIDPQGNVLARAEADYPLSTPRPGWSEQDPEDWWLATQTVLAEADDTPPAIRPASA